MIAGAEAARTKHVALRERTPLAPHDQGEQSDERRRDRDRGPEPTGFATHVGQMLELKGKKAKGKSAVAFASGTHMGTLSSELAAHAEHLSPRPRIYADANVPAGLVAYM